MSESRIFDKNGQELKENDIVKKDVFYLDGSKANYYEYFLVKYGKYLFINPYTRNRIDGYGYYYQSICSWLDGSIRLDYYSKDIIAIDNNYEKNGPEWNPYNLPEPKPLDRIDNSLNIRINENHPYAKDYWGDLKF